MKLLFFDLETTGLDHQRAAIHQIAGKICLGGTQLPFDFKMRPFKDSHVDLEALEVSGLTYDEVMSYPDQAEVFLKFDRLICQCVNKFAKTDKLFLVGYNNAAFDNHFLQNWYKRNGEKYFYSRFWNSSIDVMVLASHRLMSERHLMPNFKLQTVAEKMGVKVDPSKLHEAGYDIMLTEQLYYALCIPERFPQTIGTL